MTAIDFASALEDELFDEESNNQNTSFELLQSVWRSSLCPEQLQEISPGLWLSKDFISKEEEEAIVNCIYENGEWLELIKRKLQNWGGYPHPTGMHEEGLPYHLQEVANRVEKINCWDYKINQVLLNEYVAGQGIAAHKDGPNYHSSAAILSLLSTRLMTFRSSDGEEIFDVPLPSRSLLIFSGRYFNDFTHEISKSDSSLPKRLSLTLRRAKVSERDLTLTADGRETLRERKTRWIRNVTDVGT